MSFLKKLFSRNQETAPPKQVDRAPRVSLIPLHRVHFRVDEPSELGMVPVLNLSLSGLGLARHASQPWPPLRSRVQGELRIEEENYPLAVEMVYTSEQLVGARFLDMAPELKNRILRYFIAEFAATRMTEVNRSVLAEEPDGNPHFLVGQNQCELYYVEKDSRVVWFHLTFVGNYIEGDRKGRLKEGLFEAEERKTYKGSTMIRSLRPLSREQGELALKFLANIRTLEPGIQGQLVALIQGGLKES